MDPQTILQKIELLPHKTRPHTTASLKNKSYDFWNTERQTLKNVAGYYYGLFRPGP